MRLAALLFCVAVPAVALADATSLQDIASRLAPPPEATIYVARDILTMDPGRPHATAVAVVDGRIAALGSLAELEAQAGDQPFRIDDRFADDVLIAGFVEPHLHPFLAALTMTKKVISIEDWDTTSGFAPAALDQETYRARLEAALAAHPDPSQDFVTWGYHHYFHGPLGRPELDALAPGIPVVVWHRSAHEVILNSTAMTKYGVDQAFLATFTPIQASQADLATGHFVEQGALKLLERIAPAIASAETLSAGLAFSKEAFHRAGITTAAEPGGLLSKPLQEAVNEAFGPDDTPFDFYFVPDGKSLTLKHVDDNGVGPLIEETRALLSWGEGKARFLPQQVKLFADGAIFSQLMQMRDGYLDGHHGEWILEPAMFTRAFQAYWDAGYQIRIHVNGDLGLDLVLDNLEQALRRAPRYDHRTLIDHFGFAAPDQIARIRALGAIISANPYYASALAERYGEIGIGQERAQRIVPLGDAERAGIPISLHSDMPMAPGRPLFLVWAAVNRLTPAGTVVGADQRMSLEAALRGVTIEAAHALRLENEIGSIEPGKLANFTVLDESPFEVAPEEIDDIRVLGTVLGGRAQPVEDAARRADRTPPQRHRLAARHGFPACASSSWAS